MLTAFLISLGVMCGITLLLTALILVAEATIGNYGEIPIVINGDRELKVPGGRPLLAALKDQKIFIPSACGGRGSCGLCKLTITEGAGDVLPTELPWLTAQEKQQRIRLSCQVKVKKPLQLRIPPELLSIRQYTTTVLALRDLTHDIKEVVLQLREPATMAFKAGQFVQIEVPEYELTDQPVYRAYSVASPPAVTDRLDLEIRLVPNGICTTYVHKHLKVGDPLIINGPYGEFHLRDTAREIVFIAGGSGMAPVRSILLDMAATGSPRRARYFFGARTRRDLFLVEEMRELERKLPNFQFIPALSAPEPGTDWTGETGLITTVVDRHVAAGTDSEAYLCGSPAMIDACTEVLSRKGLPPEQIFYDKFA